MRAAASAARHAKRAGGARSDDDELSAVDAFTASLTPRYANTRKTTIYAGSNEIQRNIISKMSLGL